MNSILNNLNEQQTEAVKKIGGPQVIFAGAGSGKTTTIVRKIAFLIDNGINPKNILAITFTNKAAKEIKERVDSYVPNSNGINIGTFHSICARILRENENVIGMPKFTINDADDTKKIINDILKVARTIDNSIELDSVCETNQAMGKFSDVKNNMSNPKKTLDKHYYHLYNLYEKYKKDSNILDFDDLLVKANDLLENHLNILYKYQDKFRYVFVDECQDTNKIQFEIVKKLADGEKNICIVGDDDQSIYGWRYANPEYIINFDKYYEKTSKFFLTQNYRSTKNIIDAGNAVIKRNTNRVDKKMWTEKNDGEKIKLIVFRQPYQEADEIVKSIKESIQNGTSPNEIAILYRANYQSRVIEEACVKHNVPYKLIGSLGFYQRKEIKDILSYLKIIYNYKNNLALERIINIPKRGIGDATLKKIREYAEKEHISMYEIINNIDKIKVSRKVNQSINDFVKFISTQKEKLSNSGLINKTDIGDNSYKISDFVEFIYKEFIEDLIEKENVGEDIKNKKQNVGELIESIKRIEKERVLSIEEYLEGVALVDIEQDSNTEQISLMTIHGSKGLEFKDIYVIGLNKFILPSTYGNEEEERRLFYVAITRAKEHLTISCFRTKLKNGEFVYIEPSEFLYDIPENVVEKIDFTR